MPNAVKLCNYRYTYYNKKIHLCIHMCVYIPVLVGAHMWVPICFKVKIDAKPNWQNY